jgi:hypothetical protein
MEKSGCEAEMEEESQRWRDRLRNRSPRVKEDRARNPERIVLAVPFMNPTFMVRPGLKEPSRLENPGRAGTHGIDKVTGIHFNPTLVIIELKNVLGDGTAGTEKSKGGEDWMSAPPRGKLKELRVN